MGVASSRHEIVLRFDEDVVAVRAGNPSLQVGLVGGGAIAAPLS